MTEADVLASTYEDTCIVIRKTLEKNPNGADGFRTEVVYNNEPCALSQSQGSTSPLDKVQKITYVAKLFLRPERVIKAGDVITVRRMNEVRTFTAGEGAIYPSHIEVPLIREEIA